MKADLTIENGSVVTEMGVVKAHIGVHEGTITHIVDASDDPPAADSRIDARGLHIFPGMIEPHCHFWDPGPTEREDWQTGTMAAAAGGITTVIEMPLSIPPTVDRESFLLKKDIADRKAVVDFALWGGIIPESGKQMRKHLTDLRELGAVAYKAFMCWSAREFPPVDDGLLLAAMRELAEHDQMIGLHAENDAIILHTEAQLHAANRIDPMAHVESRPPEAELEAIQRALFLARKAGVRVHIVHMSLAEGAEIIREAKDRGQRMTVETTPQYLVLDSSELERQGPYAKCAPPLRSRENVERLWKHVLNGTIDFIGSDHAPFTHAEKDLGLSNIWQAGNGLPGIQEMFSLLLSEGVHKRSLPLQRLASITAGNTARAFRLYPQKGAIMPGADADFAIVNMDAEWVVDHDNLFYKNKWTPYNGLQMKGKVVRTIVRGETVYADGKVIVESGYGRFVAPTP